MKKTALFLYSLVLVAIWGVCFLSVGVVDKYTVAMGLGFTFLSNYFLQRQHAFALSAADKWTIAAAPMVYTVVLYVSLYDAGYFSFKTFNFVALFQSLFYLHIINPVTVAFVVLVLGLTWLKDLRNPANVFVFAFVTLFYTHMFSLEWKKRGIYGRNFKYDTTMLASANEPSVVEEEINRNVQLADFEFVNAARDTVRLLDGSGKFVLLETWAENCMPCLKAINQMPSFYRTVEDKLSVYYVYENVRASARNNFDAIFSFPEVDDPGRIVIDINQELYNTMNMRGYPYFLLFDPSGKLVYHSRGFSDKDLLEAALMPFLK